MAHKGNASTSRELGNVYGYHIQQSFPQVLHKGNASSSHGVGSAKFPTFSLQYVREIDIVKISVLPLWEAACFC